MQSFDADGSSLDPCQLQNSSNTGQFSQFYVIDRVVRCTMWRNVFPLYIYWMLCGNMKSILFIFLKVKFKNYSNDFHNNVANWNCQYCFDGKKIELDSFSWRIEWQKKKKIELCNFLVVKWWQKFLEFSFASAYSILNWIPILQKSFWILLPSRLNKIECFGISNGWCWHFCTQVSAIDFKMRISFFEMSSCAPFDSSDVHVPIIS